MMLQRCSGSRLNLPFSCLGDRASEDPCQQIGRARAIALGAAQQGGSAPPPTLSLGFMRISTSWSHPFTSWSLGCLVRRIGGTILPWVDLERSEITGEGEAR